MIKLANNNEALVGEFEGVFYSLKFHDDTEKINVNLTGAINQAFAIFGQGATTDNRKAYQAAIRAYITEAKKRLE